MLVEHTTTSINAQQKRLLREQFLPRRKELSSEHVRSLSTRIQQTFFLLDTVIHAQSIMIYLSYAQEVETEAIINEFLRLRKIVYVPAFTKDMTEIYPSQLHSYTQEIRDTIMGVPVQLPQYQTVSDVRSIDLIVVPGIIFDERGYRIGFGKGFYDTLLSQKSNQQKTIGLAYAFQVISRVPVDVWDQPVDLIITEHTIIRGGEDH